MMALARRSLVGRATIKDENAERIIKKPESEIMKMMKLGSFEIELDIARLRFWQRIFREPNHHQQVITAVFGQFSFDAEELRKEFAVQGLQDQPQQDEGL